MSSTEPTIIEIPPPPYEGMGVPSRFENLPFEELPQGIQRRLVNRVVRELSAPVDPFIEPPIPE